MLGIGLLAGIALAHDIGLGPWLGTYQIAGLAAAAILTAIPGTRRMIARGIDRVRHPSPRPGPGSLSVRPLSRVAISN